MKLHKILLIIVFLCTLTKSQAQFFPDSMMATGVQVMPSVSQGFNFFARYYRDSVTYDSTNGADEFYTVHKRVEGIGFSKSKFNLRVNNKRIYLSGTVNYGHPIILDDLLIYDYNYGVGDTFTVKLTSNTLLDIKFKVDSIQLTMYQDGIKRLTHYYTMSQGGSTWREPFFTAEGIGSSLGVVYLKTDFVPLLQDELISVCKPAMLVYGNNDCVVGSFPGYRIPPVCREDSVIHLVTEANRLDVKKKTIQSGFSISPNPATDWLSISSELNASLCIMDGTGKILMDVITVTEGLQSIDISDLKPGLYIVMIQSGQSYYHQKIVVDRSR